MSCGFEPDVLPLEHNPAGYDTVILGTPVWWYTYAPACGRKAVMEPGLNVRLD